MAPLRSELETPGPVTDTVTGPLAVTDHENDDPGASLRMVPGDMFWFTVAMIVGGFVVVVTTFPPPPPPPPAVVLGLACVLGVVEAVVDGARVVVVVDEGARVVVVLSTVGPVSIAVGLSPPLVSTTISPRTSTAAAAMPAGISHFGRPPSSRSLTRLATGSCVDPASPSA